MSTAQETFLPIAGQYISWLLQVYRRKSETSICRPDRDSELVPAEVVSLF